MSISLSVSSTVSVSSVSTTTTGSDGCVICPSTSSCPECEEGYYCVLTALTCDSCPITYCALSSTSNSTVSESKNSGLSDQQIVGSVVGSVVGGVFIIFGAALFFFYKRYWKPRKEAELRLGTEKTFQTLLHSDYAGSIEDIYDADLDDDDFGDLEDGLEEELYNDEMIEMEDTVPELVGFAANKKQNKTNTRNSHVSGNHYNNEVTSIIDNDSSTPGLLQIGNRSSSSTINTKASNILPIAYIPGVTNSDSHRIAKHSYNNHLNIPGDVKSHITLGSSIFDGVEDDDSQSRLQMDFNPPTSLARIKNSKSAEQLTTAIRAKPRLVDLYDISANTETTDINPDIEHENNDQTTLDIAVPEYIKPLEEAHNSDANSNKNSDEELDITIDFDQI